MPRHQNGQTSKRPDFQGFYPPNYTPVPDALFDEVMAGLSGSELKVLLYIIRRTFGFKKDADTISFQQFRYGIRTQDGRQLDQGCGVKSYSQISGALQTLEAARYIVAHKTTTERGDKDTTVYRLRLRGEEDGAAKIGVGVLRKREDGTPFIEAGVPRKSEGQETVQETDRQDRQGRETRDSDLLWEQVKMELAAQMSKPNYETWFRDTQLVSLNGSLVVIAAPNPFTAEWLNTRCKPLIRKTIMGILQRPVECQIVLAQ